MAGREPIDADKTIAPTLSGPDTLLAQRPEEERQNSSYPPRVKPDEGGLDEPAPGERYETRALLGRGGMGEVQLCHDRQIGRHIAMKVIRAGRGSRSDAKLRFLREARVQAQLEHPAIVPVYDLGKDAGGQLYFTMKRIRGESLEAIIAQLRRGEAAESHTRRRLLTAFLQVCMAIDYAHERGVLHRDLKPANIMLGDYGEVYVLDWGLAKISGEPELEALDQTHPSITLQETAAGEVLGTPGYIAPEQLSGDVDRRSDVYALGAILYEILTLQRLHEGKTAQAVLISTMEGQDARPSVRFPELDTPPELETICAQAAARDPDERFASARALHDALERFLDGDRDLALRRQYARVHAEHASLAADRALAGDDAARIEAMREVGRALGLDPGNAVAMGTFARLLESPPAQLPPEAAAALERANQEQVRIGARNGAFGYLSWFLYMPLLMWMGIRDWAWLAMTSIFIVAAAGIDLHVSRTKGWSGWSVVAMVVGSIALSTLYGMFGAYVFLPTVMVGQVVSISQSPRRRDRIMVVILGCLAVLIPATLEWFGLIPTATVFGPDYVTLLPTMVAFPPDATRVVLLAASLGLIVTPMLLIGRVRDTLTAAERRIQMQAWHLRQLVAPPD